MVTSLLETESDAWITDDDCDEVESHGFLFNDRNAKAVRTITTGDPTVGQLEKLSVDAIVAGQREDPDIKFILEMVKVGRNKPDWDDVALQSSTLWQQWSRLVVRNGVLCRRFEQLNGRPIIWQIVIPFQLWRVIFELVHEGMTGGHMGRKRTKIQLQNRAYWPGWTADVRRFIKMCAPCAQYHHGGPPKTSPLKPFTVGDIWELVSIDEIGRAHV